MGGKGGGSGGSGGVGMGGGGSPAVDGGGLWAETLLGSFHTDFIGKRVREVLTFFYY